MSGSERRRLARIPLRCAVVVREKLATWTAETADVGPRGCRLTLTRPIGQGALVQLRFGGDGSAPLEAVGQVVWTRKSEPPEAGVAFVSAPRAATKGSTWIDTVVAAQLRGVLRDGSSPGDVGNLGDPVLRLGAPPRRPFHPAELAAARVAEAEGRLSEIPGGSEGIEALAGLLEEGTVTIGRAGADVQGWKRALALPVVALPPKPSASVVIALAPTETANGEAIVPPSPSDAAVPPPVLAVAPPPEEAVPAPATIDARASQVAAMIAECLLDGDDDVSGAETCVA